MPSPFPVFGRQSDGIHPRHPHSADDRKVPETGIGPGAGDEVAALMSWSAYILRCRDGSLYTGCTNDLDARIAAHNAGETEKKRIKSSPSPCVTFCRRIF